MKKQHFIGGEAGWRSPQLLIQIRPLLWGLGLTWGRGVFGFSIGPGSLMLYWAQPNFEAHKYGP